MWEVTLPLHCRGKVTMKSLCLASKQARALVSFGSVEEGPQFMSWVVHGLDLAKNMLEYIRENGPAANKASSLQQFTLAW